MGRFYSDNNENDIDTIGTEITNIINNHEFFQYSKWKQSNYCSNSNTKLSFQQLDALSTINSTLLIIMQEIQLIIIKFAFIIPNDMNNTVPKLSQSIESAFNLLSIFLFPLLIMIQRLSELLVSWYILLLHSIASQSICPNILLKHFHSLQTYFQSRDPIECQNHTLAHNFCTNMVRDYTDPIKHRHSANKVQVRSELVTYTPSFIKRCNTKLVRTPSKLPQECIECVESPSKQNFSDNNNTSTSVSHDFIENDIEESKVKDSNNMKWIDVGTKIGLSFLHSEHVAQSVQDIQKLPTENKESPKAISKESSNVYTSEKYLKETMKPVHPLRSSLDLNDPMFDKNNVSTSDKIITHMDISSKHHPLHWNFSNSRDANQYPYPSIKLPVSTTFFYHSQSSLSLNDTQRRPILLPAVKIMVPMFPCHHIQDHPNKYFYQMATVKYSHRIHVFSDKYQSPHHKHHSNCLSIHVVLDNFLLRQAKFAEMTLRILDSHVHMPRHSKFPIGSCLMTLYGIGILVGWRVEDDCHILVSLWNKSIGSARGYFHRSALLHLMPAAIGYIVHTHNGGGKVLGYTPAGNKYIILQKHSQRNNGELVEIPSSNVFKCLSATFIPILEQIQQSAKYQLQLYFYKSKLQRQDTNHTTEVWQVITEALELGIASFFQAAEEDLDFDTELQEWILSIITCLEKLEIGKDNRKSFHSKSKTFQNKPDSPACFLHEFHSTVSPQSIKSSSSTPATSPTTRSYERAYTILHILSRTAAIARSSCSDRPKLQISLSILDEVFIFIRTFIRVHQKHMLSSFINDWKDTFHELAQILGPIHKRIVKIGKGIVERLESHGNQAKLHMLQFVDIVVRDDRLFEGFVKRQYADCIHRLELAAVQANIVKEESWEQFYKVTVGLVYFLGPPKESTNSQNQRTMTFFAKLLKSIATPRKTLLQLIIQQDVLDIVERVLIRVFEKDKQCCLILNIFAYNFRNFWQIRTLRNMSICGGLWSLVLDAADEEFCWAVSRMPEQTRKLIGPISKLFSLGVSYFHQLYQADSPMQLDFLEFLLEEEAVTIIQEFDKSLLVGVKKFGKYVKEIMGILPYYSRIDEDILHFLDEVEFDKLLKEAAEAILDKKKFNEFIRDKSIVAVSKFLDRLPQISIPIDRRDIGDGWVITCRGRQGEDLSLSRVNIQKDNLICSVLGSGNVLSPMLGEVHDTFFNYSIPHSEISGSLNEDRNMKVSILNDIREIIHNAQNHGSWKTGVGGVDMLDSKETKQTALDGLPLTEVLRCAIGLWKNHEISDDELLEIAIREVSFQIRLQNEHDERKEQNRTPNLEGKDFRYIDSLFFGADKINSTFSSLDETTLISGSKSSCNAREHCVSGFNPRRDPTVLYLEMNDLSCSVNDFTFRIEPMQYKTIFDPMFEGIGSLNLKNVSIKLRVECRKKRIQKLHSEMTVPVLFLQTLDVGLEEVNFKFKETGVDWLLNKIVSNFCGTITDIVKTNIKDQITFSLETSLQTINSYIEVNPHLMLRVLGITTDDLEEIIAWV